MARSTRRVRMVGIWSSAAVVAALALAGPAGAAYPGPTTLVAATAPVASANPLPLPDPGKTLRQRAEQAKLRLDASWPNVPDAVASYGVDEHTGKLNIDVVGQDAGVILNFLVLAGSDPTSVIMHTDAQRARPYYDLVGGNAIYGGNVRCSLGTNAKDRSGKVYVLTAGHCAQAAPGTWYGYNNSKIGTVKAKKFPGNDYAEIAVTNSAWKATAKVAGGPTVKGSNVAAVASKVCRSGSTTGYKCGIVQAYNQTVNYGNGDVVMGLTKTSACAEPGDSGGTFITPTGQVQGFTSGGSGDCTAGGTTYFQPVKQALSAYGLTLVTG